MGKISVNQAGYLIGESKSAVCLTRTNNEFSLCVAESGKVVFSGALTPVQSDEASGDNVRFADFSAFNEPGTYYVRTGISKSSSFCIGENVYEDAVRKMLKSFYFQRCGIELLPKYGKFTHKVCHHAKAALFENEDKELEVSGGWHDAGDYGRYSSAAATTLGQLLYAYRLNEKNVGMSLNIPESGNGIPDILNECRYELDWLLKMQDLSDGGVYHKVTTERFCGFVMPEDDIAPQWIFRKSCVASAQCAAAFALASGIYAKYDTEFADNLSCRAELAYAYADAHPDEPPFTNPEGVNTGSYRDNDVRDDIFWAACELYSLTGKQEYHAKVRELYGIVPIHDFSWNSVGGFGSLCYILTERNKDSLVYKAICEKVCDSAEKIYKRYCTSGYGAAIPMESYLWGSSMIVANAGNTLMAADLISPNNNYRTAAYYQLAYLLGRNPLNVCYITGVGSNPVKFPHHRHSSADGIEEPVEGLVAGGPDAHRTDEFIRWNISEGTPPAKCYIDDEASYSSNEVAIYWNGAVILLASFFGNGGSGDTNEK